jgi:two-component system sensor histidine kinase YesM
LRPKQTIRIILCINTYNIGCLLPRQHIHSFELDKYAAFCYYLIKYRSNLFEETRLLKLIHLPKSVLGKLILTNVLLILSMSLIGFLSFFTARDLINTYIRKSNINTLTQIKKNIGILIDQAISVVSLFDHNLFLEKYLTEDNRNLFERLKNIDTIETQIRQYSFAYDWLKYNTILLGSKGIVYNPDTAGDLTAEAFQKYDWYRRAMLERQKIYWLSSHPDFINPSKKVFTAVKTLHNSISGQYYGTLLLSIDESCLYNIYRDSLESDSSFSIIDSSGNIVSHSTRDRVGTRFDFKPFAKLLNGPAAKHQVIRTGHRKYLCIYQKVERVNWTIINLIPLATVSQDINALALKIFLISLVLISFSVSLAVLISRKIAIPLINLKKRVQSHSQPVNESPESTLTDEITVLTREYEHIVAELEKTINHLLKEQEEKRKAELHALQMQIRPHFLYNTINSIKCLLWAGKTELIEPTVNALVNLLEQTISRKEELISLEEELQCVKDYIYIQEIRSSHTIRSSFQIPEALQACLIPKLLLQPLVENAIFHGFEPKPATGKIWGTLSIYATAIGRDLQLEILDDGVGMEQSRAEKLLTDDNRLNAGRFSGIGVKNVQERIQLYFGARYGLTIHSEPGVGTSIVITLPQKYVADNLEVLQ